MDELHGSPLSSHDQPTWPGAPDFTDKNSAVSFCIAIIRAIRAIVVKIFAKRSDFDGLPVQGNREEFCLTPPARILTYVI